MTYREWWLTGQYPNVQFALSEKPEDDSIHVVEYQALLDAQMRIASLEDQLAWSLKNERQYKECIKQLSQPR